MTEDRKKKHRADTPERREKAKKYKWLRLPLATEREAAERREYLISAGVIREEVNAGTEITTVGEASDLRQGAVQAGS
jgi:hypothetical protein